MNKRHTLSCFVFYYPPIAWTNDHIAIESGESLAEIQDGRFNLNNI